METMTDGRFHVGDEVFFAGDLAPRGCNAEYALIDSRIVGRKPIGKTVLALD
jgi:NADPH:quinone reductase